MGLNFSQYEVVGSKTYRFWQKNGHKAVQGHSRSLILVPIKSLYATSYISESYKLTLKLVLILPTP